MPLWEDLTDPGRYHDAKYETLKAAAWNSQLADVRGRAPYGARTLTHILLGNDYMATRYQRDPDRRKARRRLIVASEHFGTLEGLRGGADKVLDIMDELREEGYVQDVQRSWEGGSYCSPAPTAKGWARLETGRLFD